MLLGHSHGLFAAVLTFFQDCAPALAASQLLVSLMGDVDVGQPLSLCDDARHAATHCLSDFLRACFGSVGAMQSIEERSPGHVMQIIVQMLANWQHDDTAPSAGGNANSASGQQPNHCSLLSMLDWTTKVSSTSLLRVQYATSRARVVAPQLPHFPHVPSSPPLARACLTVCRVMWPPPPTLAPLHQCPRFAICAGNRAQRCCRRFHPRVPPHVPVPHRVRPLECRRTTRPQEHPPRGSPGHAAWRTRP